MVRLFTVFEVRDPGSVLHYAIAHRNSIDEEWKIDHMWFWSDAPRWVVDKLNTVWEM